jgi:chemotaxis protein CheD
MVQPIPVGMAEMRLSDAASDALAAMGLGSCIGVCLYDPKRRLAAMAHVVLPASAAVSRGPIDVGKFADTAVPELVRRIGELCATPPSLRAAIAGGAELFALARPAPAFEIGRRNVAAVRAALAEAGVPLVAEDTGGNAGRTLVFEVGTGIVRVRVVGAEMSSLATLGSGG